MKISIVTSVFPLRDSRPTEYYLLPLQHFLEDMKNSAILLYIFTNLEDSNFPNSPNINIIKSDPDQFAEEIFETPNWKQEYANALSTRPSSKYEEKNVPSLISIWLGKFAMMELGSENTDFVLWQDSGIRSGKFYRNKFQNYRKCKAYPERYLHALKEIISNYDLVCLSSEKPMGEFHGVPMNFYNTKKKNYLIRAGFILTRSSQIPEMRKGIKKYWKILTDNNDYGTEENPLTLYQWNHPNSLVLSFEQWVNYLGIAPHADLKML